VPTQSSEREKSMRASREIENREWSLSSPSSSCRVSMVLLPKAHGTLLAADFWWWKVARKAKGLSHEKPFHLHQVVVVTAAAVKLSRTKYHPAVSSVPFRPPGPIRRSSPRPIVFFAATRKSCGDIITSRTHPQTGSISEEPLERHGAVSCFVVGHNCFLSFLCSLSTYRQAELMRATDKLQPDQWGGGNTRKSVEGRVGLRGALFALLCMCGNEDH